MKITKTKLPGILIIQPDIFEDPRGFFMETYHQKKYAEEGLDRSFVQDNLSYSTIDTLRGLHYQYPNAQAKLIQAIEGEIFDVAVDIRRGSPAFGQWTGVHLSGENKRQLFVPEGFAHGFCVISDTATVVYKCTDFYAPESEKGIIWSDSDIGIEWPVKEPLLSSKDSQYPCLKDIARNNLPDYRE